MKIQITSNKSHTVDHKRFGIWPACRTGRNLPARLDFAQAKSGGEFRISRREAPGMTLLLVILIISALLSISIGIFDVVLGEFRISGEITDSFIALYAADQGMEKTLYDDRVLKSLCPGDGPCSYGPATINFPQGACVTIRLSRIAKNTTIVSTGEYRCASPALSVKRAFQATYAH